MPQPGARPLQRSALLLAAAVLVLAASAHETGDHRVARLLRGPVHTRVLSDQSSRRGLSEMEGLDVTARDVEQTFLIGLSSSQDQDAVQEVLEACGAAVLHPLPGGPADQLHLLVAATPAAMEHLLTMHPQLTTAPMPAIHKTCPHVEALLRQGHASAPKERVTLLGLMPHATPELLDATARKARNELQTACDLDAQISRHRLVIHVCRKDLAKAVSWMTSQPRLTWVSVQPKAVPYNLFSAAIMQAPEKVTQPTAPRAAYEGIKSSLFPLWQAGLDGTGQVVGVTDTGIDTDSCFFWDPAFPEPFKSKSTFQTPINPFLPNNAAIAGIPGNSQLIYEVSTPQNITVFEDKSARKVVQIVYFANETNLDVHGSHTTGTVAGSVYGTDYRTHPTIATGVAPGAKLAFFNLGVELIVPIDPGVMYDIQYKVGARISSNSWGTVNAYFYSAPDCYLYDAYTWFGQDMLHVFAAGNDGSLQELEFSTGTASAPATCKNILSVGATESWTPEGPLTPFPAEEEGAFFLKDKKGKLVDVTTPLVTPDPGQDYQIVIESADGSLSHRLVDAALYFPVSVDSFLYFASDNGDLEYAPALDENITAAVKDSRRALSTGDPKVFDSDVDPLVNKSKIRVVLAQPEDSCRPLDLPSVGPGETVVVLVRKQFTGGRCPANESLIHVRNSGAHGAIVYFSDTEYLVDAGAKNFRGREFPALTIGRTLGDELRSALLNGTRLYMRLEPIHLGDAPFEDVAGYSGFGSTLPPDTVPTDYGFIDIRFKPDIMAPGRVVSVHTDYKITGKQDRCAVTELQGTSMAAPGAAGSAAIVRQYFEDGWYPSGAPNKKHAYDPSAPLTKAMLIAGAASMTGFRLIDNLPIEPAPSPYQGFGRVDLSTSLPLKGSGWRLQVVDGAEFTKDGVEHVYRLTVPPRDKGGKGGSLIVTLVWNDFPAFPGTSYALTNNLDVVVTGGPGGDTTWWGNGREGGDYLNNVERVHIADPAPGEYTISVRAAYLFSMARPQKYALVALGDFTGNLDSPFNPAQKPQQTRRRRARTLLQA